MVNPYNFADEHPVDTTDSRALEAAREFARWILKSRTDNYRAKRMFEEKGYRGEILETVMAEYMELNEIATRRRTHIRRATGAALFFGSLVVLACSLLFNVKAGGALAYLLIPTAILGLFRMILPNMLERV
jgi:hypothetical protein